MNMKLSPEQVAKAKVKAKADKVHRKRMWKRYLRKPKLTVQEGISASGLITAIAEMECLTDSLSEVCIMHPKDFAGIRRFDRDVIDIETQRGLLERGIRGYVWCVLIQIDKRCTEGEAMLLAKDNTAVCLKALRKESP